MTIDTSREAVELRLTRLRAAYEKFRAPYGHIAALITQAKLTETMMDALLAERDEYRDQIAELLPAANREAVEQRARAEAAEAERDAALAEVARLSHALAAETAKREAMEEALEEISTYDTGGTAGVAYTAKVTLAKHGSKT